jgi:tRNA(fMet)-specific endonuclease VapC
LAYLVDTNIVVYARDGSQRVLDKFAEHSGQVLTSVLCLVELQRGTYRDALRLSRLETLLRGIPILSFDIAAAQAYGRILAQCGWARGRDYDRMIAAHAISTGSILVTNNIDDFRDISGLSLENWIV